MSRNAEYFIDVVNAHFDAWAASNQPPFSLGNFEIWQTTGPRKVNLKSYVLNPDIQHTEADAYWNPPRNYPNNYSTEPNFTKRVPNFNEKMNPTINIHFNTLRILHAISRDIFPQQMLILSLPFSWTNEIGIEPDTSQRGLAKMVYSPSDYPELRSLTGVIFDQPASGLGELIKAPFSGKFSFDLQNPFINTFDQVSMQITELYPRVKDIPDIGSANYSDETTEHMLRFITAINALALPILNLIEKYYLR